MYKIKIHITNFCFCYLKKIEQKSPATVVLKENHVLARTWSTEDKINKNQRELKQQ